MNVRSLVVPVRLLLASALALPVAAGAASIKVRVVDADGAPVADAAVYALPASGSLPAGPKPKGVVIDQIHRQFVPFVTVMQTGGAVTFPNKDNIRHDVYSFSPTKVFVLKLYSGTPALPIVFDKPGVEVLGCNIHDHMLAFVFIVDTPYFAKTAADGSAVIDDLPAGSYQLNVRHPRVTADVPAHSLTLAANASTEDKFSLTLGPPPAPMSPSGM